MAWGSRHTRVLLLTAGPGQRGVLARGPARCHAEAPGPQYSDSAIHGSCIGAANHSAGTRGRCATSGPAAARPVPGGSVSNLGSPQSRSGPAGVGPHRAGAPRRGGQRGPGTSAAVTVHAADQVKILFFVFKSSTIMFHGESKAIVVGDRFGSNTIESVIIPTQFLFP